MDVVDVVDVVDSVDAAWPLAATKVVVGGRWPENAFEVRGSKLRVAQSGHG